MNHLERPKRKKHPKEECNIISDILFLYASDMYKKGLKKEIDESDLYEVHKDYRSEKLGNKLEISWNKQKKESDKLSITKLLWKSYGPYYIFLGMCDLVIKSLIMILQPYGIGKFVSYFVPGQTDMTRTEACLYAAFVICLNFFNCIFSHNYYLKQIMLGIKVRTAFSSFIYRKALKVHPTSLSDISVGKIVTLITKDVHTFESFIDFFNDIWIGIFRTCIICFVLYMRIGISALVGVAFFIIILPLQVYCGSMATNMKLKLCRKTDERLQTTQETLSAIRIIKMYTWEKIFTSKILQARKKEVNKTYKIFFFKFMTLTIGSLNSHIAFYMMIATYIWLGNAITAEIIYFVMSCFHNLSVNLGITFPIGVYQTAELAAAIKRFGKVMKAIELDTRTQTGKPSSVSHPEISLENISVSFKDNLILNNINLKVHQNGLTLITGAVGSGKSFLLKTILQDFAPTQSGTIKISGEISYASQEPWLFPSSIRQNILFGEKYDEKRYQQVLKVCALLFDFQLLKDGDNTIVEDRGINLSKGQQARVNLARAVYKDSDIYLLDDCLSALDANVSAFIFKTCIKEFLKNKLVILVTHNLHYCLDADNVIIMDEGRIISRGNAEELPISKLLNINNDNKNQEINERKTNKLLNNTISNDDDNDDDNNEEAVLITETTTEKVVYKEEKRGGEVDFRVYRSYIKYGGGIFAAIMIITVFGMAQFIMSYTDKLVSVWVNLEQKLSNHTIYSNSSNTTEYEAMLNKKNWLFYMYSFMTLATAVMTFGRALVLLLFGRRAALKLHKIMVTTIINAKMSFFDTNFIGNILNRFSKDLINVDELLPFAFYHVLRVFFILTGVVTLIATVNAIFLAPTAIFFCVLVFLRKYSLKTTRNLKRMDATTRSPMIGHLNATLEGLTTIRAFKTQEILKNEFDRHQDLYTSANFTLQSSMRAFQFTLDMLCSVYIATIVLKFLIFDENNTLAGNVGLVVSQAFMLTGTLQWGIRQWAEIENQMTSVERVLDYTDVERETSQGIVPKNWPESGEISYKNVYLSYFGSNEYVLKNINFAVKPCEKIGVVGRTGAGKSSIIATLFRLYEVEGTISIDGIDIKTVSLAHLRSNISIIPQDPVLFTGSIRDNIDPTGKYADEDIWRVIESSNLKPLIPSLDFQVTENGLNFSIGQKQLVCLARALIRNNKIIVLDEATANMDEKSDLFIQDTIQNSFRKCTVFIIAHKLKSVMSCDKILVMDKGEIVEFDSPQNLINQSRGFFYDMVKQSRLLPDER